MKMTEDHFTGKRDPFFL